MSDEKPKMVSCTFDSSEKEPEIISCTFDASEPQISHSNCPPVVICPCPPKEDSESKESEKDAEECTEECGTPPPCPKCKKTDNVIPIEYGIVCGTAEMLKKQEDGLVILGGCMVEPENYKCKACNEKFE